MAMQVTAFSFGDFFPSLGWMDNLTGLIASLKATSRAVDALLDQLIEEHKILNVDEDDDKKGFLHILLKLQKEGMLEIELTQDNLKAVILISINDKRNFSYEMRDNVTANGQMVIDKLKESRLDSAFACVVES
ncbi:cytochrome p450 71a1 [Quercus suber]|uniref:Cytochrome p450 71a1 n=1 Tax=Quercus suber TaxID=58331 RepID=A0AAW0LIG6_QUESU